MVVSPGRSSTENNCLRDPAAASGAAAAALATAGAGACCGAGGGDGTTAAAAAEEEEEEGIATGSSMATRGGGIGEVRDAASDRGAAVRVLEGWVTDWRGARAPTVFGWGGVRGREGRRI